MKSLKIFYYVDYFCKQNLRNFIYYIDEYLKFNLP